MDNIGYLRWILWDISMYKKRDSIKAYSFKKYSVKTLGKYILGR